MVGQLNEECIPSSLEVQPKVAPLRLFLPHVQFPGTDLDTTYTNTHPTPTSYETKLPRLEQGGESAKYQL